MQSALYKISTYLRLSVQVLHISSRRQTQLIPCQWNCSDHKHDNYHNKTSRWQPLGSLGHSLLNSNKTCVRN